MSLLERQTRVCSLLHRPPRVAAGDARGEARAVDVPQHGRRPLLQGWRQAGGRLSPWPLHDIGNTNTNIVC